MKLLAIRRLFRIRELLLTPSDDAMCADTELLLVFAARAHQPGKNPQAKRSTGRWRCNGRRDAD